MSSNAHNEFPPSIMLLSTNLLIMLLVQKKNLLVVEANVAQI